MKSKILWVVLLTLLIYPWVSGQGDSESEEMRDLIHDYGMKGYEYLQINPNLDSAEYYLQKALELQYATPKYDIDDRVAANHILLASVYGKIFNNHQALEELTKAENILIEVDPSILYLASIYTNKGNILYVAANDVYKTKEYYEYAMDFMIRNGFQNTKYFPIVFSNYITLLFDIGDTKLAEEKLKLIDFSQLSTNSYSGFRLLNTVATSYGIMGKYEQAITFFDQAREILLKSNHAEVIASTFTYYYSIIDFYILYEEYREAAMLCQEALFYIESLDPSATKNQTLYQGQITYRIASIKHRQGNFQSALDNVNQCIDNQNQFFAKFASSNEQSYVKNVVSSTLPQLYILKSRLLYDQYLETGEQNKIEESLDSYQTSINALNSQRLFMKNEDSKIFATSTIIEVYNEAIQVGNKMYELTENMDYLEMAFEFTESSKSFALFSEINNLEAMEFSDLPAAVRDKEQELSGKIQGYENLLYQEQLFLEPDSANIALYKDKLFHLKADRDKLLEEIERDYAKYFEFKYQPHFVTLEELQDKLPHRDAMIEYVLADSILTTYVIDKNGINVFSQEIDSSFNEECMEYYQLLNEQNFSNGVHDNFRRFVELGRKFYSILVEPCLQYTDRKNLTIIPDGAITYLPFEGFLTEDADTEYINYLTLPYLIREYSVGYSQSATLMFSERLKSKPTEDKVLAFAPLYLNPNYDIDTTSNRQVADGSGVLLPLGGIIKEVQSIKEMVPARVLLNENATEAKFKELASDYNILHLAMHTIMKDDAPLSSWLAFTNAESNDPGDTIEDNRLYAYEVYNLSLNAEMAVLSSCNSGFGKMHRGEGMMSLARAFYYAGCPSIVMTLWQVSDKSSSELMTSFYRYLKKGRSKQEAMRLAKIDYLDSADDLTSNPYFWSGFVVLGDSSPIYKKTGIAYWISIIILFIGILIYFQYKKKS